VELRKRLEKIHDLNLTLLNFKTTAPKLQLINTSDLMAYYDDKGKICFSKSMIGNLKKLSKNYSVMLDLMLSEEDAHFIHHRLIGKSFSRMGKMNITLKSLLKSQDQDKIVEFLKTKNGKKWMMEILWKEGLAKALSLLVVQKLHKVTRREIYKEILKIYEYPLFKEVFFKLYHIVISSFLSKGISNLRKSFRQKKPSFDRITKKKIIAHLQSLT